MSVCHMKSILALATSLEHFIIFYGKMKTFLTMKLLKSAKMIQSRNHQTHYILLSKSIDWFFVIGTLIVNQLTKKALTFSKMYSDFIQKSIS